jgi:hypothetical protein
MSDLLTTNYLLVEPQVGASADTWGGKLNADFSAIDALLGAITTGGSANAYTLTTGQSLVANVSGQAFHVKWSFGNTGAATINVDGIGAKALTKNGANALISGDLVSGTYARVTYDGTQFQVGGALPGVYQPLSANLTALGALTISANTYLLGTGANAFSVASIPAAAQTLIAQSSQSALRSAGLGSTTVGDAVFVAANAAAGQSALALVPGTNVQTQSGNLNTYAGIAPSANAQTLLTHTFGQMLSDLGAQASLGYTAANDTAVCHNSGTETWGGDKTMTGNLTVNGTITGGSDRRIKQNIRPLTDALEIVGKLQGRRFEMIAEPDAQRIGFVAQEIGEHLPEVVVAAHHTGMLSVAYGDVTALLVEAVKTLSARVWALEAR